MLTDGTSNQLGFSYPMARLDVEFPDRMPSEPSHPRARDCRGTARLDSESSQDWGNSAQLVPSDLILLLEDWIKASCPSEVFRVAVVGSAFAFRIGPPPSCETSPWQRAFQRGLLAIVRGYALERVGEADPSERAPDIKSSLSKSGIVCINESFLRPSSEADFAIVNVIERLPPISIFGFVTDLLRYLTKDSRLSSSELKCIRKVADFYYTSYMNRISRPHLPKPQPVDTTVALQSVVSGCSRIVGALGLSEEAQDRVAQALEAALLTELDRAGRQSNVQAAFADSALEQSGDHRASAEHDAPNLPLPVPDTAPALWKKRDKNNFRNPAHFILEKYRPYLGSKGGVTGITRPDLKRLDFFLYRSLNDWLHDEKNKSCDDWLNLKDRLPTLPERNTRLLNSYESRHGVGADGPQMPDIRKIGWVAHSRSKRQANDL